MNTCLKVIFMIFLSMKIFAEYKFPIKNPYVATIVGSSKIMTEGVPYQVPTKAFKISVESRNKVPLNMWLDKGFTFSFINQKGKVR